MTSKTKADIVAVDHEGNPVYALASKNQLCVHGRCDECPECVTEGAMQAIYAQPRETPTHNVGSLLDRLLAEYKADPRGMMWTEWLVEQVSIQMRERQTLAEAFKRRAPETTEQLFTFCIFEGAPPSPHKDWNAWAKSRPLSYVTICAAEKTEPPQKSRADLEREVFNIVHRGGLDEKARALPSVETYNSARDFAKNLAEHTGNPKEAITSVVEAMDNALNGKG